MSSARTVCPHCQAQLRISVVDGASQPAKCRVCKRIFTPVLRAEDGSPLIIPPSVPLSTPLAATLGSLDLGASAQAMPPLTPLSPTPENPPKVPDLPPVEAPRRDPPAKPPSSLEAVPPKFEKIRSRHRAIKEQPSQGRTRVLVGAVAFFALVAAGLFFLVRSKTPPASEIPLAATDERKPSFSTVIPSTPLDSPLLKTPNQASLPVRLIGSWELRADDGRAWSLDLFADGTMASSSSAPFANQAATQRTAGLWHALADQGDFITLELGLERGGVGNVQLAVQITQPEAFTLLELIAEGVTSRKCDRFVRIERTPLPSKR